MDKHVVRIKRIVGEISSLRPRVDRTIDALKNKIEREHKDISDANAFAHPDYWRLDAYDNGMKKIRLMIEENFIFVNTFGTLATTRYILELLIWCRLLEKDTETYACWYAAQLIADQLQHNQAQLAKIEAEIALFKTLQDKEQLAIANVLEVQKNTTPLTSDSFAKSMNLVTEEIDRLARRRFSLYLEQAKTNGYGYQADYMEKKCVPHFADLIKKCEHSRETAKVQMSKWPNNKKWIWKDEAKNAQLSEQFDFVYGYASRLLHAKPVSFGTNQQKLEANEIAMFGLLPVSRTLS